MKLPSLEVSYTSAHTGSGSSQAGCSDPDTLSRRSLASDMLLRDGRLFAGSKCDPRILLQNRGFPFPVTLCGSILREGLDCLYTDYLAETPSAKASCSWSKDRRT
jgi:hypothetical protein